MTPDISVVVPTYRRRHLLERSLNALLQQDLEPHRYEIIIADDAADPDLEKWLLGWKQIRQHPPMPELRYVAVKGPHGPAAARNQGWKRALGVWIAFTDDDCIPDAGWLKAGLAALGAGPVALWGKIRMPLPPEPTDYEKNAAGLADAGFVTANCFCSRAVLEAIGGFDERFRWAWREDSDLFFRILQYGGRVAHASNAVVVHPIRPAPWGISLLQQKKILFDALLYKKHPRLYREKIRPWPPLRYYGVVAALGGMVWAGCHHTPWLWPAFAVWFGLTAEFTQQRLQGTSRRWTHILEMAVTSILIPPLAIFWRLQGAARYRVLFL